MLNISTSLGFLSKEDIKAKASSIFTTMAINTVSPLYTHIPTSKVVEDMEKMGWKVTDVKEVKARKNIGFQKHLIIFRNENIVIQEDNGDTVIPQILLTNSHDGKNAFIFIAGLFRAICENGLVITTAEFENVKMRHMGYTFVELQQKIKAMIEKLPLSIESMNTMENTQLDKSTAIIFATKALSTRFHEKEIKQITVDFDELLKPIRKEDKDRNLWSIFNIVQEKIIKGNFNYTLRGNYRKARQIKGFNKDLEINKKLFEVALEFIN